MGNSTTNGADESDKPTAAQVAAAMEASGATSGLNFCDWLAVAVSALKLATAETNSLLAYNYLIRERPGLPKLSKTVFRCALAEKLLRNALIPRSLLQCLQSLPLTVRMVAYIRHGGPCNDREFPTIKAAYVKWPSKWCKRKVRTCCTCDISTIICSICCHVHVTEESKWYNLIR